MGGTERLLQSIARLIDKFTKAYDIAALIPDWH
jgi:hypothetical protein